MLARIVYYVPDSIPQEEIIAASSFEKALEVARAKLKKVNAIKFEIELI